METGLPATSSTSTALAVTGGAGVTGDVICRRVHESHNAAHSGKRWAWSEHFIDLGRHPVPRPRLGPWSTLAKGTDGYVLTLVSGLPAWQASSGRLGDIQLDLRSHVDGDELDRAVRCRYHDSTRPRPQARSRRLEDSACRRGMYVGGTLNVLTNALINGNTIISGSTVLGKRRRVVHSLERNHLLRGRKSDSSSTSTGSMTTLGGFGVAKSVYVGGSVTATTGLSPGRRHCGDVHARGWSRNQGASMSISTNRLRFGAVTNATSANATAVLPQPAAELASGSINTAFTLEFYFAATTFPVFSTAC